MDKKPKPAITGKIPIDEPLIKVSYPDLEKYTQAGYEVYAMGTDFLINKDVVVLDLDEFSSKAEPIVLLCLDKNEDLLVDTLIDLKPAMSHMHFVKLYPELDITYIQF